MLGESDYARRDLDAYWTEPWVTEWLLDALDLWPAGEGGVVWEPACGAGWMAGVLEARGLPVLATDVVDYGYARQAGCRDFLSVEGVDPRIRAIVTNPPYRVRGVAGVPDAEAVDFIRHALRLLAADGVVCMLLRNEYDCAASRRDLFQHPFAAKLVLTRRPQWIEGEVKASPRHNYAWFVWRAGHSGPATHKVLP